MDDNLPEKEASDEALYSYKKGNVSLSFSPFKILIPLVLVLIIGAAGYYFLLKPNTKNTSSLPPTPQASNSAALKSDSMSVSGSVEKLKFDNETNQAVFVLDTNKNVAFKQSNSPILTVTISKDTLIHFLTPPKGSTVSAQSLTYKDLRDGDYLTITVKKEFETPNVISVGNIKQIEAFINR